MDVLNLWGIGRTCARLAETMGRGWASGCPVNGNRRTIGRRVSTARFERRLDTLGLLLPDHAAGHEGASDGGGGGLHI